MIEPEYRRLSIVRQCELVSISRSGFYYRPAGETPLNLELMRLIDAQLLETLRYGSRRMVRHLRREGHVVGRKRVRPARGRRAHLHGRTRTLDGQRVHRAAVAQHEIRVRVSARFRNRIGAARRAVTPDRLLQCPAAPFDPGRVHTR